MKSTSSFAKVSLASVLAVVVTVCNGQATSPQASAAAQGLIIAPVQRMLPTQAQRDAGATLAAQGGQGVMACNSCHGAQGEGGAATGFPRIAGQSYAYLLHELETYAQGARKNAVMQPIAAGMSAEQRQAAAAYFASLIPGPASAASAPEIGSRGSVLAKVGDETKGLQACANCHGPGGIGAGEQYPYLAGQHASYLKASLEAWRDGLRSNDQSGQMPLIAKSLSAEDIAALAAYYGAMPPRATPVDADGMAKTRFLPAGTVLSGPRKPDSAAAVSGAASR